MTHSQRALIEASVSLRRKREQTASGQHALRLQPAVHLLTAEAPGVPCEGDALRVGTIIPTHLALCSTPAGAAEHLRSMRRAVMLSRKKHAVSDD
jgi:hypothetical protein